MPHDIHGSIRLLRDIEDKGVTYPEGTHGTIVHRYTDEEGCYEVELPQPKPTVVFLTEEDMEAN